ncbi:hypothetical protein [Pseudomonas phage Njord]|uniref:Uncharacterized protein n=1 Tax=Pseudomonas phage Njord TaxID=2163985 RepID=A0A2S1GMK5_9CAUD|nr:hypothetical protein HOT08_gp22 [Pseudomonas phage Njord]AWD90610.1 hypothetical protein [Pseudomonas phage Njord]
MAHLNRKRDVNDSWVIDEYVDPKYNTTLVNIYCGDFRLEVVIPVHELWCEPMPAHVDLIQTAEYLWRPGHQVSLPIQQARSTITYLRGTSHE